MTCPIRCLRPRLLLQSLEVEGMKFLLLLLLLLLLFLLLLLL